MVRFKVLVSAVPLIAAAVLARVELFPTSRPCIALGSDTIEIASTPWHADLRVSFTDDPRLATVRVAISDSAETADFAVIDDVDAADEDTCAANPATKFTAISTQTAGAAAVIYLSHENETADYRIFVRSTRMTEREAAALIVGARSQRPHLAAAL